MAITLFKILKSSNLNLVQSLNQNGRTRQSGLHLVVVLDVVEDEEDDDDGHGQGAEGAADGQDDSVDPAPAGFRNFRFRRSMNLIRIRNKFVKKIAAVTGITRYRYCDHLPEGNLSTTELAQAHFCFVCQR